MKKARKLGTWWGILSRFQILRKIDFFGAQKTPKSCNLLRHWLGIYGMTNLYLFLKPNCSGVYYRILMPKTANLKLSKTPWFLLLFGRFLDTSFLLKKYSKRLLFWIKIDKMEKILWLHLKFIKTFKKVNVNERKLIKYLIIDSKKLIFSTIKCIGNAATIWC